MEILGISHIGIAAKDPEKAHRFFHDVLKIFFLGAETVLDQKTHAAMFASSDGEGHGRLELLRAMTPGDGPIGRFVEKRGGGIHHIALRVADIVDALQELRALGIRLIDETPRQGANGSLVAFIHPEATGGVLVELVQD